VNAAHPNALLIIIPRFVERGLTICDDARKQGFDVAQRSVGGAITAKTQVYVADTLGEAGYWYGLCHCAVIGGGFDDTQGHNPWEAARLGCPILHGPNTANFQRDYSVLDGNGGAVCIQNAQQLADAILQLDRNEMIAAQTDAVDQMTKPFDKLARDLIAAIE
jgi:3-deoxy-D-manno-octulosonic-acid transferase